MTIIETLDNPGCGCEAFDHTRKLISIDAALATISSAVSAVEGIEVLPLAAARGRILAEPVVARALTPPFDNSAMDGYAIDSAALQGAGPWRLKVVGRITAGEASSAGDQNLSGQAVQLFTGAPMPRGADAVVMQEAVQRCGDEITLTTVPKPGAHVRRAGEDMGLGAEVLAPGCHLGAREIAACAAAGQGEVSVHRRIRVALLTTGDELAVAGSDLEQAQIWDVNGPMIAAAIPQAAFDVVSFSAAGDDPEALRIQLSGLLAQSDLVVTSGGISVGEADFVKPVMQALGVEELFSGVAIKPGKPVSFGRLKACFWLGLPGNPVSAFVTWMLFGRHLLQHLSGESRRRSMRRHVVLGEEARHRLGRCELRPAQLNGFDGMGREIMRFGTSTHSARLSTIAEADGVIFIPGDSETIAAGGLAEFLPFGDR
ncbi:molybdopterin molybdotransferase MoeA [Pseudophaeobacter sp.]|uniref:molybdopterin molybdotransferase MoeA n=1 Tax=Pseudophaeobacter sp. TaxID=1971739 RepID=UPI004058D295